jgi:hypothetical protein
MRSTALSLLALLSIAALGARAVPPNRALFTPNDARDAGHRAPARSDTVWFGGDDGNGAAYPGGAWDWDTPGSDPLQGWSTEDMTQDNATAFCRVTADSFTAHGDPCVPMFAASAGELWCGVHQDDADRHDYFGGMGYGNNSCARAISPSCDLAAGESLRLRFAFFNDTEPTFDYTYVYLLCYGTSGTLLDEHEVRNFTGVVGSYDAPAFCDETVPSSSLPAGTAQVAVELRFRGDGGWSDEDGNFLTDCGPFAFDDVRIDTGALTRTYDFEDGAQGWRLEWCAGVGAFMALWPQSIWSQWLEEVGLGCHCTLAGNALGFCDADAGYDLPGFTSRHWEQAASGPVDRAGFPSPDYNDVRARWAGYYYLPMSTCSFYRPGYEYYPYSTDANPSPHWSPRSGQDVWYQSVGSPMCAYGAGSRGAADFTYPPDGDPMPPTWERMRFVFETLTEYQFQLPDCYSMGETYGSPLIDRVQVGLTWAADSPAIVPGTGMLYQDGFGQRHPTYVEPGDVGNANVAYDLSHGDPARNHWNADSSLVGGPVVNATQPHRWLARLCVRVARKGPRQDLQPAYLAWKQRLAHAGDPEQEFVCVLMDSVEVGSGVSKYRFVSFFHESDPGFDPAHPDLTRWQEILPDSIWSPGTRVEYKFQGRWFESTQYGEIGPWEFEILPGMRRGASGYSIEWPSVLYLDAFDGASEPYVLSGLDALGLVCDKYDYLDAASSWNAPLERSFGGSVFNPGGYGNNGCTREQLLGYRLILVDAGTLGVGAMEADDFDLLDEWLASTDCGMSDLRRGIVLSGDGIGAILDDPTGGIGHAFMRSTLGAGYDAVYRLYNQDSENCVYLEPTPGAVFSPASPGIGVYGNGCPNQFPYTVLGIQPGVSNVTGNLRYFSYQGTGILPYVDYAEIVRRNRIPGVADWRSVVEGFAWHHLSERGCGGEPCASESTCIARGLLDLIEPELAWIAEGELPFGLWRWPCASSLIDDSETHLSGPVDFLYAPRPNPFRGTATIRFTLAAAQRVTVEVFDIAGREVRTLLDGPGAPGENTLVWDGADNTGRPLGRGLFWAQMRTAGGYRSSRRLVVLR